MEKVLYVLWRDPRVSEDAFARRLRGELADRLLEAGARGLHVNVADAAVQPAAALRQVATRPQMDAVLSLWVDSAIARFRRPFDELVEPAAGRMAAYLVT